MSPASYRTAPPRVAYPYFMNFRCTKQIGGCGSRIPAGGGDEPSPRGTGHRAGDRLVAGRAAAPDDEGDGHDNQATADQHRGRQPLVQQRRAEDDRFHMEGGSWTSDISWVRGYDLAPMDEASSLFHERVLAKAIPPGDSRSRNALFHLLTAETSCYRYWGEGIWTDYGAELARRTIDIVTHDL